MAREALPGLRPAGRLPGGRLRAAAVEWWPCLRGWMSRRGGRPGWHAARALPAACRKPEPTRVGGHGAKGVWHAARALPAACRKPEPTRVGGHGAKGVWHAARALPAACRKPEPTRVGGHGAKGVWHAARALPAACRGVTRPLGAACRLTSGGRLAACPNPGGFRLRSSSCVVEAAFRRLQACCHGPAGTHASRAGRPGRGRPCPRAGLGNQRSPGTDPRSRIGRRSAGASE
jgi:hypothetical protein